MNPRLSRRVTISLIFLSYVTKLQPRIMKPSIMPTTVTCCNLSEAKEGYSSSVNLRGHVQRPLASKSSKLTNFSSKLAF